jgi:uncharacterized membrane protein
MSQRIQTFHRLLAHHRFYALALISGLACALLAVRMQMTGTRGYLFLVWNLFLAWLPYGGALWAASLSQRHPHQSWRLLVPGALWLLFLPNAPYLITDFVHLPRMEFVRWYDIGVLTSFALSGWLLGAVSLRAMQELVAERLGALASWAFVLLSAGLCGLGVYIGRFLRWNSWDVFFQPRDLMREALVVLNDPANHARMVGVTLLFAALMMAGHLVLAPARSQAE